MTTQEAIKFALEALEKDPVPLNAINNAQYFLLQALAQDEQEPVAWLTPDGEGFRMRLEPPVNDVPLGWKALYTAPPPKPWVGLTVEEIKEILYGLLEDDRTPMLTVIDAVQEKLKEKNGAT